MKNKKLITLLRIIDDNDYVWHFDGERIYLAEAEDEAESENYHNGYYCDTWQEAIEILIDDGYLTKFGNYLL